MTQDEIIEMAIKAGLLVKRGLLGRCSESNFEAFAKLVAAKERADEREACAKLCEEAQTYSMPISCPDGISGCLVAHYIPARREKTGSEAAAAIRARAQAEKGEA